MPPVGSFRFINLNVDLFRLQKLLGNVVISQGGVVPHIAPVSCMIVVFLFVNLDLFSTLRNFCPQNRVNQRRTRRSARSFSSFHFYICTVHQGCILVIYYFFQLSNYMRFIEFFFAETRTIVLVRLLSSNMAVGPSCSVRQCL